MADTRQGSQTRGLLVFFALAYAISWLAWLPSMLVSNDLADLPEWSTQLRHLGTFGPFIAAFILVFRSEGAAGMKRLWKRGWSLRFDKRWLIPVFGIPVLLTAATVAAIVLLGGSIEWERGIPLAMLVPVFLLIYLTNALPEEYGWRGFALDRLQVRNTALVASLILGVVHGLWHLPLHFMDGTVQEVIPVWEFTLKTMVGAVIYTWLFNNTGGSVFIVILYHAFSNTVTGAVPWWITSEGRWVNFGLELIIVVVIVVIYGSQRLARASSVDGTVNSGGVP